MNNHFAPIVLFVYNRPEHTKQTIEALSRNTLAAKSELYIFSDGPTKEADVERVKAVRTYIGSISGFRQVKIYQSEQNRGLAQSVISGVSHVIHEYGRAIVLEDDLVTSPYFLSFMNAALDRYANNEQVMQVSGYMYPVVSDLQTDAAFLPVVESWGWATWKRAWDKFDSQAGGWQKLLSDASLSNRFDLEGTYGYSQMLVSQMQGRLDSWAVRWNWSVFCANGLVLYPKTSLVQNIGFDGSGTHCSSTEADVYHHDGFSESTGRKDRKWIFPAEIKNSINLYNGVVKFLAIRRINEMYRYIRNQHGQMQHLQSENKKLVDAVYALNKQCAPQASTNYFCTLFDSVYLTRGLVMYESLRKTGESFHLYIVCFDDLAYQILGKINLPDVTLITLGEFEDDELLRVKPERSKGEYCWTCTSSVIKYCLEHYALQEITYVDADLYFYQKPSILLHEFHKSGCSVSLSPHNYSTVYEWQAKTSGIYCVQFMTFKADEQGMKILSWWRDKCIDWCFSTFDQENDRFGDQKYLDKWPELFEGVYILKNQGAGVAPWNIQNCQVEEGPKVNGVPTVFFHYHGFKWLNDNRVILGGSYLLELRAVAVFYQPYIKELLNQTLRVLQYDNNFSQGRTRVSEKDEMMQSPKTLIFKAFFD